MKVLVVGSGGREHALVWKIHQSPRVKKIYCAPGNAGIKNMAECVDISAGDVEGLVKFALKEKIDLTVVGPEQSLTEGIVDRFEKEGLRIFGPSQKGAILEGSKVFTKEFLKKYDIPTARFEVFSDRKKARKYIDKCGAPVVVKADGLAAGKGVIVASSVKEAKAAVDLIMAEKAFGEAGNKVIVEECLKGEEASFIAFTDGKTILPLPTSQDHKAVYDGDKGPNTGGMGAYSPAPVVTEKIADYVMEKIMLPTVEGMAAEGRPYKGMLYAGLMIDGNDINVLEFNCRFGDPEAQPLLMRLKSDVVDIFEAVIDGTLDQVEMKIDPRPTVCVVMASGGYPGKYQTGKTIQGLGKAAAVDGVVVFHAGTKIKNGRTATSGGRVLGVTAVGKDLQMAIDQAYKAVSMISWTGSFYRTDIGGKALKRVEGPDNTPLVGIVMGSDSDLPVMQAAGDFLASMGIPYEITVASAHRSPERATHYAAGAKKRGMKVIIAGAGMAAHLAGVLSSHTDLPVIGVPLDASPLQGMDALLATVQMPPGIPVGTMGIGKAGAKNGAVLAARILALNDKELSERLVEFRAAMAREVEEKAKKDRRLKVAPQVTPSQAEFGRALETMEQGGIVAYPTETFYGLAVDPDNDQAIQALYALKGRAEHKPISLLVPDRAVLKRYVAEIPSPYELLMNAFWPGPLTLVFPARPEVSSLLCAGGKTLAIRISSHPVAQEFCRLWGKGLTATSANPSGSTPLLNGSQVREIWGRQIGYVLDGGSVPGGKGSTIVELVEEKLCLLRSGVIAEESISRVLEQAYGASEA